jgi:hypothetical protein
MSLATTPRSCAARRWAARPRRTSRARADAAFLSPLCALCRRNTRSFRAREDVDDDGLPAQIGPLPTSCGSHPCRPGTRWYAQAHSRESLQVGGEAHVLGSELLPSSTTQPFLTRGAARRSRTACPLRWRAWRRRCASLRRGSCEYVREKETRAQHRRECRARASDLQRPWKIPMAHSHAGCEGLSAPPR